MTIVSFQHGFLFIKTRKVAGTSVEAALRALTGPDDVVAGLTPPRDEHFCAAKGLHARNYARREADETAYRELVLAERFDEAAALNRRMPKKYHCHMRARELRWRLGRKRFASLYRFSIERNPYSWLVSVAGYDKKAYRDSRLSAMNLQPLRENIAAWLSRRRLLEQANYGYYTIRGAPAVDRIIRYEHLESDLAEVLAHLGLATSLTLPQLKVNPQEATLREIYTEELAARVRERFAPVFELMGYPDTVPDA